MSEDTNNESTNTSDKLDTPDNFNFHEVIYSHYKALNKREKNGVHVIVLSHLFLLILLGVYLAGFVEHGPRAVVLQKNSLLMILMGCTVAGISIGCSLLKRHWVGIKIAVFACLLIIAGTWISA